MNVTIESINGKQYTVVWHDDVQSFNGTMTATHNGYVWHIGSKCVATLLPALPRHPKPEDQRLLYRYMAEGIKIHMRIDGESDTIIANGYDAATNVLYDNFGTYDGVRISLCEITYATALDGNRIEIAIEG